MRGEILRALLLTGKGSQTTFYAFGFILPTSRQTNFPENDKKAKKDFAFFQFRMSCAPFFTTLLFWGGLWRTKSRSEAPLLPLFPLSKWKKLPVKRSHPHFALLPTQNCKSFVKPLQVFLRCGLVRVSLLLQISTDFGAAFPLAVTNLTREKRWV